ncbi:hypothetical protein [Marinibactrum halimedae]|uniref:Uncharacterized protein n=1 Tax=Marinibactrum halimedae TaxID=1444977 RepID=A0AA37TAN4_9GAMM|nr:hypothetical protein [Marinibactrum halimedae]MCD9458558.1 hypothetical protein [Marinibactrum halimedae]GLS26575.1 hypothetical protein GCM10007877_22910 [Marinibactrum halimedae]
MKPLNPTEYTTILEKGRDINVSRNVFVSKKHLSRWQELQTTHQTNFYRASIFRMVYNLGGISEQRDSQIHSITKPGVQIIYRFNGGGDTYIESILFGDQFQPESIQQNPNIYEVICSMNEEGKPEWNTKDSPTARLMLSHKWDGLHGSHRIAIGGKYENKESAGSTLIEHIKNAYAIQDKMSDIPDNFYTLAWLNGEFHKPNSIKLVLDAIITIAAQGESVDWLIQGNACETFANVMQALSKHPRLQAEKTSPHPMDGNSLESNLKKQRVFFSNPRGKGVREEELEALCNASGLTYHGTRINAYDWRNEDALRAVGHNISVSVVKIAGSGIVTFTGAQYLEPLYEMAKSPMTNPDIMLGLGVASAVLLKDFVIKYGGYGRNIPKAWKATAGQDHLQW